jgi:hypothetical protein
MFLAITDPIVLPIYRTKDRTMLRINERNTHGRLALNLEFPSDVEARRFVEDLNFELNKELPKE